MGYLFLFECLFESERETHLNPQRCRLSSAGDSGILHQRDSTATRSATRPRLDPFESRSALRLCVFPKEFSNQGARLSRSPVVWGPLIRWLMSDVAVLVTPALSTAYVAMV